MRRAVNTAERWLGTVLLATALLAGCELSSQEDGLTRVGAPQEELVRRALSAWGHVSHSGLACLVAFPLAPLWCLDVAANVAAVDGSTPYASTPAYHSQRPSDPLGKPAKSRCDAANDMMQAAYRHAQRARVYADRIGTHPDSESVPGWSARAAAELGRVLHIVQDNEVHQGMTNPHHSYLDKAGVSPDEPAPTTTAQVTATTAQVLAGFATATQEAGEGWTPTGTFSSAFFQHPGVDIGFLCSYEKYDCHETSGGEPVSNTWWDPVSVRDRLLDNVDRAFDNQSWDLFDCDVEAESLQPEVSEGAPCDCTISPHADGSPADIGLNSYDQESCYAGNCNVCTIPGKDVSGCKPTWAGSCVGLYKDWCNYNCLTQPDIGTGQCKQLNPDFCDLGCYSWCTGCCQACGCEP